MANRVKEMQTVRAILQLMQRQVSLNKIAGQLHLARRTVRKYAKIARQSGYQVDELLVLDDPSLCAVMYPPAAPVAPDINSRCAYFLSRIKYYTEELKRKGVTRQLLWKEYQQDYPVGYSYSQFCYLLEQHQRIKQATMHFEHQPADKMLLDFAGGKLHYTDPETGEVKAVPVLIAVLPFSGYSFAIALADATLPQLVKGLNKCVTWFGGLTVYAKFDNMAQVVKRSCRYEPVFTEMILQWSMHYGIGLLTARVRKPRDKAHVENEVKLTYQRIYAPLRDRVFFSLAELNSAIEEQLRQHHHEPFQKETFNRQQLFESQEKPLLSALPSALYELKHKVQAKVCQDYHIILGEDWHHYSVPYQYIGKQLDVIYDIDTVEIYHLHQRVALHRRSFKRRGWTTLKEHMPEAHQKVQEQRGWNKDDFLQKAAGIGPDTLAFMEALFQSRTFTEQCFQASLGIMRLAKTYGPQRLEAACKRAVAFRTYSYRIIHTILNNNMDKEELPSVQGMLFQIPEHENVRGSGFYE
jgi:transposase